MKGLKGNKGFTLIELLAVIVVLAIVMVLAVTTVLPYMNEAKKEAFVTEAAAFKDAATNAMSLITLGTITSTEAAAYIDASDNYCFDLSDLKDKGLFEKDDSNYDGTVLVKKEGNKYSYTVSLTNGTFYLVGNTFKKSAVMDKKPEDTNYLDECTVKNAGNN